LYLKTKCNSNFKMSAVFKVPVDLRKLGERLWKKTVKHVD